MYILTPRLCACALVRLWMDTRVQLFTAGDAVELSLRTPPPVDNHGVALLMIPQQRGSGRNISGPDDA
eukprot:COSAG05_NODE_379_length_10567_cov_18.553687_11_plen_68_part_00